MLVNPNIRNKSGRYATTRKQSPLALKAETAEPIRPRRSKQSTRREVTVLLQLRSDLDFILHPDSHVLYPPQDRPWEAALDVEQLSFLEEVYVSIHTALHQLQSLKQTRQSTLILPLVALEQNLTGIQLSLLLHQLEEPASVHSTLTTSKILDLLQDLKGRVSERLKALGQ